MFNTFTAMPIFRNLAKNNNFILSHYFNSNSIDVSKFLARMVTTVAIMNSSDSEDEVFAPEVDLKHNENGDNLWTEIQQNPELFILEKVGVELDTSNFIVQTLVDLFFRIYFLHY